MRSSSSRSVAGLAVLCCALSACGSGTSASTPSAAVSSVAAPSPVASAPASSASRTPTASPSGSYDPALVAEAEKVFREYQAAFTKWQQKGGSTTLPSDFSKFAAGASLKDVAQLLAQQKYAGWHLASSPDPVVHVDGVATDVPREGAELVIAGCVDGSKARVIQSDGTSKPGVIVQYRAFFSHVGGSLKETDELTRQEARC